MRAAVAVAIGYFVRVFFRKVRERQHAFDSEDTGRSGPPALTWGRGAGAVSGPRAEATVTSTAGPTAQGATAALTVPPALRDAEVVSEPTTELTAIELLQEGSVNSLWPADLGVIEHAERLNDDGDGGREPTPATIDVATDEVPPVPVARSAKRIEPILRGGRPREPQQRTVVSSARADVAPRLEAVCWKAERVWHIGVEVSPETSDVLVTCDGEKLVEGASLPSTFELVALNGEVRAGVGDLESNRVLLNGGPMVFKLGTEAADRGRRVRFASPGQYLVVAPEHYSRDPERAAPERFAPEPVAVPGFRAHFFDVDDEARVAFSGIPPERLELSRLRVDLAGSVIEDRLPRTGPLFGSRPPVLRASRATWEAVSEIVFGEEGSGVGRWKMSYKPNAVGHDVELPRALLGRRIGWYFARLYDAGGDLLTSFDFRLAAGLRALRISEHPAFPGEGGHEPVAVEIDVEVPTSVHWERGAIDGETRGSVIRLTVPADPILDEVPLEIRDRDTTLPMRIVLDRVWWGRSTDADDASVAWTSRPMTIVAKDVSAISPDVLYLRFPRAKWSKALAWKVGRQGRRRYLDVLDRMASIPLREVIDAVPRDAGDHELVLTAEDADGDFHSSVVARFERRLRCRMCSKEFAEHSAMQEHLQTHEYRREFVELGLDDLRERYPDLPRKVYRCTHCVKLGASHALNPHEDIVDHINHDCKAPRDPDAPKLSFAIITEPATIRAELIKDLARIMRCRRCSRELDDPSEEDCRYHVLRAHTDDLIEIS